MSIQSINASSAALDPSLARMANAQASAAGSRNSGNAQQANATAEARSTASTSDAARADAPASAEPSRETLLQAVEDVQKAIAPVAQNLLFSIDDDTGRTIVKVVDSQTDQVIRQMPSEEVLAIAKAIDKLQGLLIKQQA